MALGSGRGRVSYSRTIGQPRGTVHILGEGLSFNWWCVVVILGQVGLG